MLYLPAEDSFLLEKEVKSYIIKLKDKNIKVLDMGSGSGIQAKACLSSGIKSSNVLCADIDQEAINFLNKQKLKTVQTNLFSKIKNSKNNKKNKFDLIIFNAPYLPEDKNGYDNGLDTTAGKKGNEVILEFLKQAKTYLNKGGRILLLFSNLSKPRVILEYSKKLGYKFKKLSEESMGMFEKVMVYEFSR